MSWHSLHGRCGLDCREGIQWEARAQALRIAPLLIEGTPEDALANGEGLAEVGNKVGAVGGPWGRHSVAIPLGATDDEDAGGMFG
ncbi:uncharacterized protein TRAVEDRAFT_45469 [Trametes versicolor FP-101664 SS1]|uniref:uncharacterized protein n=1 Tax=Trametes versicolor (strain FP-101664) TaxID=717944 RepID=UPI0004621AD8|nr:uncharacterized protein TRAVEDRAFT_45469 [Trametes versicolor FP-101664 SS1]EIW60222.1 hypothetical protein TRAVEDRAFT_45469 [Trametes versicolor FP-101664 SS1]